MDSQIDSLNLPRVKCLKLSFDYISSPRLAVFRPSPLPGYVDFGQELVKKSL